jgi:hypothetical protein
MFNLEATRALLDDDQGVCPEGHDCRLSLDGTEVYVRKCVIRRHYSGWPLVRLDLTPAEIDAAEAAGADPDLIWWARNSLAERDANPSLGDVLRYG